MNVILSLTPTPEAIQIILVSRIAVYVVYHDVQ